MKKKKVLFIIESFIVGGAEKVLIDIVNHLDVNLFDITVCSVYKHSVYKGYDKSFEKPFKSHIKYRTLINNRIKLLYILFNYLLNKIPNVLYQLLLGNRYNTVVAFYEGLPTYWVSQAKLKGSKKIAWLHTSTELSQQGKSKEEINKQLNYYSQFNQIIAVSQGVADSFTHLFPTLSNVKVIYNPINTAVIQEKATYPITIEKKVTPTFVCVGRMTEVKGYDRWLRVLLKLKEKGYVFQSWIIGGGDREKYETFVKENQLTDDVVFLGHQDNPYPYMALADYFVSMSYTEGLGMSLIEALTLNKPVICSKYPAAIEILGDNDYGFIFEQDDVSLLKVLENVFKDPSISNIYKNIGYNRAQYFDINGQLIHITKILS